MKPAAHATPAPPATPDQATPGTSARASDGGTAAALERRLTELEIKASFADDLLDTLNQLVARQQETIELLVREVSRLRQQGHEGGGGGPAQRDPRDERPPHY